MQKYEYNNDGGEIGCHPWMTPEPHVDVGGSAEFYLASDVDARIAELEKELSDAKSLAISLDTSNERLRQKIDRLRA